MRLVGGGDEKEGLVRLGAVLECGGKRGRVGIVVASTCGILEGENGPRIDVRLAGEMRGVACGLQVMGDAFHPVVGHRVVRIGSGLHRIEAGVECVTRGRAHGRSLEAPRELHALTRELIEMRCLRLPAIHAEVAVGAVVGDDEQEVRWRGVGKGTKEQDGC